jgi:Prealbumin-like fold domain
MANRVLGSKGTKRRRRLLLFVPFTLIAVLMLSIGAGAAPLTGSSFDAANGTLTDLVDHDWNPPGQPAGNIGPLQPITCPALGAGTNCGVDRTNSSLDDSFTQGPKEDDQAPVIGDGSIPPNKDDLSRFYVNQEKASGNDFLYLAWERTATLGSAHMDFEFNQSNTPSANGVTKVRTAGDLLVTFDFGGSGQPVLSLGRWVTSGAASQCEASNSVPCWGDLVNLTTGGIANGAVNNANVIDFNPPNAPRTLAGSVSSNGSVSSTFGEAAINLTLAGVFPANRCAHFGAAMLKSRSSGQSFTSSLKDFIAPIPVNITNCGSVIIHKVTNPPSDPATVQFGYTKAFNTDPASGNTFSLGHGQSTGTTFEGNVLPGSGYTVDETSLPAGWTFDNVNCNASTGVTPSINGSLVTFAIDSSADILDCTYTNRARGTIIVEKITDDGQGAFDFTSNTLTPSPFTLTTTAPGAGGKDSRTFGDLAAPGTYDVAETVPAGWNLVSATCDDGSSPASIGLSPGETVTCTFHDARERGALRILKNSTKGGPVSNPGAVFSYDSSSVTDNGAGDEDPDVGEVCVSGLLVGTYTVNETSPPPGYGDASQSDLTATVVDGTDCGANPPGAGATVTFTNPPLADIQVNFRDGGSGETSATSITCANTGTTPDTTPATGWDDSVTHTGIAIDPSPRTVTCTIVIDP